MPLKRPEGLITAPAIWNRLGDTRMGEYRTP